MNGMPYHRLSAYGSFFHERAVPGFRQFLSSYIAGLILSILIGWAGLHWFQWLASDVP